jgi:hypothetical protein
MKTILVQENLVENAPVNKSLTACKQYCLAAGATLGNIDFISLCSVFSKNFKISQFLDRCLIVKILVIH